MSFGIWKASSLELRKKWKAHGLYVDEIPDNIDLSNKYLIPAHILGVASDTNCDTSSFKN